MTGPASPVDPVENLAGKPPRRRAPAGTVDTHMHVFEPGFPIHSKEPPVPDVSSLADYRKLQHRLGMDRAVIVQPNAYGRDNACLEHALKEMGDAARGIAAIPPDTPEAELERLHGLGVRGARIMDFGNGAVSSEHAAAVADLIAPLGWHIIVQFDGGQMEAYEDKLRALTHPYVIDHAGKFLEPVATDSRAFASFLRLIDRGNCHVKISACYETSRVGAPGYDDVGTISRTLIAHAPERMLWASNWPHVSATAEGYPDDAVLLDRFHDWAGDERTANTILVDTPARLYGF